MDSLLSQMRKALDEPAAIYAVEGENMSVVANGQKRCELLLEPTAADLSELLRRVSGGERLSASRRFIQCVGAEEFDDAVITAFGPPISAKHRLLLYRKPGL
jgi:hypothetical protein